MFPDRNEGGFSTAASIVAMAFVLLVVAILMVISFDAFGGSGGQGSTSNAPSILSNSSAETQIKLCAEGRDSSYGDPPSPGQQGKCVSQLAGQISGDGSSLSGVP